MDSSISNLIVLLASNLISSSIVYIFTSKAKRRKDGADAEDAELKNTQKLIDLYKDSFTQIDELYRKKEQDYIKMIKYQDDKIDLLNKNTLQSNKLIKELRDKVNNLSSELTSLKETLGAECIKCINKTNCEVTGMINIGDNEEEQEV